MTQTPRRPNARLMRRFRRHGGTLGKREIIERSRARAGRRSARAETVVPLEHLAALNASLTSLPPGFAMHRKLQRVREKRPQAFANPDDRTIDWSAAEELAFASILADGVSIRLTGEDVERGTFSHRHAVYHDVNNGRLHVPRSHAAGARGVRGPQQPATRSRRGFEYG